MNHDDLRRPEVQFASFLRDRYPLAVRVEVFANRDGRKALRWLLRQLDANGDGILTAAEKEQVTIIIYGHSWGGSQTVTLARQLDRLGIQVRLTIQMDSVGKLWQSDSRIPAMSTVRLIFISRKAYCMGGPKSARPTQIIQASSETSR